MSLTIIEKILNDQVLDKSALVDTRVKIFEFLAINPDKGYTMRQLIEALGLPDNRRLLQPMMNVLFQYNTVNFDYNSKTYRYHDSNESKILKNYINLLRAM